MKMYYDRNVKAREYKPGDKVLVLLPLRGNPLQAKYHGPYKVLKKLMTWIILLKLQIAENLANCVILIC